MDVQGSKHASFLTTLGIKQRPDTVKTWLIADHIFQMMILC